MIIKVIFECRITKNGLVVQLVRIPACHAGGREFESRPDRISIMQNEVKACKQDVYRLFSF